MIIDECIISQNVTNFLLYKTSNVLLKKIGFVAVMFS